MKRLHKYLKAYLKESVLAPLFKMCEATLELLVPLIVAQIIDVAIPGADKGYAVKMCLVLLALGFLGLLFSVTAQFFAAKAATGFSAKLRQALFIKIQSFSCSLTDRLGAATMITRLTSDMNQVQTGVNLTLRLLLRSPFVVIGAAVMAFLVDAPTALVFVVAIPVLMAVILGIMLVCIPLYKKVQEKLDGVLMTTRENLSGVRVIRAFRLEESEKVEFGIKNSMLTAVQRLVGFVTALLNPVTYVIVNAAVIWLIYKGAIRVEAGIITQGAVVAIYNYMSQILVELIKLADLIINVTRSLACANRIADVLDMPSDDEVAPVKPAGATGGESVEFINVKMSYNGASGEALSGVSFIAKKGEHIGVIGSTGSGKSTLVNLIPRLYDATEGEVLVGGKNVNEFDRGALRSMIGVVPQKIRLFKGTIRENLLIGGVCADEETINAAVKTAQAQDVVEVKGGLDGVIEQNGRNLSGGQRQRLAIARALTRRPAILILDDSSSALDFATDAALRKALREYSKDMTVFTVSQRVSSIAGCDKIIVLDDGKVAGIGGSDELLKSCPVYREIYDSQYRREAAV